MSIATSIPTDKSRAGAPAATPTRRLVGVALLGIGLLIPVLLQWSVSSLADELGLEIEVVEPLRIVNHSTANSPVGSGPLATARVTVQGNADPLPELRTQLRSQGFTLRSAEPETWIRPRNDGDDATVWTLRLSAESSAIDIAVQTLDDDARIIYAPVLILSLSMMISGAVLVRGSGQDQSSPIPRAALAATVVLTGAVATTIAVRALHQARLLIDAHIARYGHLPDELGDVRYVGTQAERLLGDQLCVVAGLYPFTVLWALASVAFAGAGALWIAPSRRWRIVLLIVGATAAIAVVAMYGTSASAAGQFLE